MLSQQVGDFGLSRLKHETYLTTKTGKGTVLTGTHYLFRLIGSTWAWSKQ